jgi:4-aminobutyrate aminotransferase-like enzyme
MSAEHLERILESGRLTLEQDPAFLDKFTYAGHHPIGAIDYNLSHGPVLINTKGEKYYDSTAYWLTNLIDYTRHPELNNMTGYTGKLAFDAPTMSEMNTPEQAAFTQMMLDFWPSARHIFTHPSGALAVNDACWTAAAAVAEKEGLKPREMKGVAFENAFHGRHDRGADATGPSPKVDFRQYENRLVRCTAPNVVFDIHGKVLEEETKILVDKSMRQVEEALKDANSAYVILEYPIQAEGGARMIDREALPKLHDLCQKYEKFLILDCVQMGGRSWSIRENSSVSPFAPEVLKYADMITFGKVFRISGFMAAGPVSLGRGFREDTMDVNTGRYGATWVGRTDQALTGTAVMETVIKENLWKNGLKNTGIILNCLAEISEDGVLVRPRGRAEDTAYVGWDFADRETRDKFVKTMRDTYHILMLGAGEKSIRWGPFLDATDAEIKNVLDSIEKCCKLKNF